MRSMFRFVAGFVVALTVSIAAQAQTRAVSGNTLTSDSFPKIKVTVDRGFKYAGRFEFTLRDQVRGERFVFVDAGKGKQIKRLFIAQFEAFLPAVNETYNYSFANAETIAGHKFRHNTFAFSNAEAARAEPAAEAALTARFLRSKNYEFQDEWMMSRFLTVPDAERRNELILFYIENVADSGKRLSDLYSGDDETEVWVAISRDLTARSRKAFTIS